MAGKGGKIYSKLRPERNPHCDSHAIAMIDLVLLLSALRVFVLVIVTAVSVFSYGTELVHLCFAVIDYLEAVLLTLHAKEREVRKASRELNSSISNLDDNKKIEILQQRATQHLANMKRLERENQKHKKRGDLLQKEKDHARTDLSKTTTLKEKLEKLCRELQRENNRLKVRTDTKVPHECRC